MMYQAKYRQFVTKSESRFAEPEEIRRECCPNVPDMPPKGAGAPLFYNGTTLFVDNDDNHTMVIGPTGSKKSRVVVFPTVASIIEAGESAIINDPKGEIYRMTAAAAIRHGAEVRVLNFRKPGTSHSWNPMMLAYRSYHAGRTADAMQHISDLCTAIVGPALLTTKDRYWADTSGMLLSGIIMMLLESVPADYFHLKQVIPFCYESALNILRKAVDNIEFDSSAESNLRAVTDLTAEKTISCIYSSLLAELKPFIQNQALLEMLCRDDVDMASIAKKQTLVYVIYPDEKESLNFLVNLFFTQCYEMLVAEAAAQPNDRLPLRVNFVLDEFSNLAPISNFANRISESRSKNIRYFLYLQAFGQLCEKYGDSAESILANCNNWICFSSKEMAFLEKLSRICGREVDYNGAEHALISPFAMQHLRKEWESAEVLIVKQGQYPFVTALPDFACISLYAGYRKTTVPEQPISSNMVCQHTPSEWFRSVLLGDHPNSAA